MRRCLRLVHGKSNNTHRDANPRRRSLASAIPLLQTPESYAYQVLQGTALPGLALVLRQ